MTGVVKGALVIALEIGCVGVGAGVTMVVCGAAAGVDGAGLVAAELGMLETAVVGCCGTLLDTGVDEAAEDCNRLTLIVVVGMTLL